MMVRTSSVRPIRIAVSLTPCTGAVRTGVRLKGLRVERASDTLAVWARLDRDGNAAFIGSIRAELVDARGRQWGEFTSPLGVYRSMEPRFAVPVGILPPGTYRLRVELASQRDDLAPEVLLKVPPVRDSIEVRVP